MSPQSQITVFRGFVGRGCYAWSPFVSKLEARLRFGGIQYDTDTGDLSTAPRGKVPYVAVKSAAGVELLGDSTMIIRAFIDKGYLSDLNADLTAVQRAQDLALRSLCEDKLYFYQVRERWIDNYYQFRDGILASLPYPVRVVVGLIIHRSISKTLQGQGTLRYSSEEIAASRVEVWGALNTLLTESRARAGAGPRTEESAPFWILGGPQPTEADSVVHGFVVSCLACPSSPTSQKELQDFPVVLEYVLRIHKRYFDDYDLWGSDVTKT